MSADRASGTSRESTALVRFAVVGCGVIGSLHAEVLSRHPGTALTAVLDTDPAAAAAVADAAAAWSPDAPPAAVAASLEALLDRDDVDAVAVCTPSGRHAAVAVPVLGSGRHLVVEKPVEVTVEAARPVLAAAAAAPAGTVASVISQHRFDPASVALRAEIDAGGLGRLCSAVASVPWWRADAYYASGSWRGTRLLDGGGALENQGVHTVDLLVWLLGEPVDVVARTARLAHDDIEVEDTAAAVVRFASGALATLHATTAAYPGLTVRLSVMGDRGSAVLDNDRLAYLHTQQRAEAGLSAGLRGVGALADQSAAVVGAEEAGPRPGGGPGTSGMFAGHLRQYDDVVDAIRTGRAPGVGLADGLLALATVRAVYLAAEQDRPVRVAEVLGADAPGAEMPGTDTSGTDTPGTDTPGTAGSP